MSATEYVAVAWAVAVVGVLLSLGSFWLVQQHLDTYKLLEFRWVAENRHRALKKEIDSEFKAVASIRDLFLVSGQVNPEDFRALAQTLLERHRGIYALGWLPRVPIAEAGPQSTQDAGTRRGVRVAAAQPRSGPGSGSEKDNFFPLLYIEPYPGKDILSGFDPDSSPLYQDLLLRARGSREMVVSGRIPLNGQGVFGFAAFLPVHEEIVSRAQSANAEQLLGYAMGIFRISELATTATSVLEPRGVEFLILDNSAPEGERFLDFHPSRLSSANLSSREDWQAWQGGKAPRLTQVLQVANREWSVMSGPTAEFRSAGGFQEGPWVVLISGLAVTVLLTLYLRRMDQNLRVRTTMEAALREREELFRQMTEAIQEVFWIQTPDGSGVLYVSPAYETIWGRSCSSLYQDPKSFLDNVHPDDRANVAANCDRASDGESEQVFRILRPDGAIRWVRSRAFAIQNELGEVFRVAGIREDITEIKQAEEALRDSEKQLRSLFDQSPDIIKVVDDEGRILSMSRSLPELSVEDAIGRSSVELLPPDYWKRYKKGLRRVFRKGKPDHFQYATSDSAWWDVRIVPIRRGDGVHEAMVIYSDVTETKALEAKAIRSARLASLGVLAAGVAHEINNPNNSIQFNVSVLTRVFDDTLPIIERHRGENGDFVLGGMPVGKALEAVPRMLSGIRNGSLRIQRIVGNLKHMSRQDTGDLSLDIDLLEVLRAAISILRNQVQKHTDRFVLDLPDNLPPVRGSAQQLEQVFINIVMNALQALTERTQMVRIGGCLDDTESNILVSVRDEGRGIPEDEVRKVTTPFFTTKEATGGTGLGMSISETIVRRHKGSMDISSELGLGTEVIVKLPVAENRGDAAQE